MLIYCLSVCVYVLPFKILNFDAYMLINFGFFKGIENLCYRVGFFICL